MDPICSNKKACYAGIATVSVGLSYLLSRLYPGSKVLNCAAGVGFAAVCLKLTYDHYNKYENKNTDGYEKAKELLKKEYEKLHAEMKCENFKNKLNKKLQKIDQEILENLAFDIHSIQPEGFSLNITYCKQTYKQRDLVVKTYKETDDDYIKLNNEAIDYEIDFFINSIAVGKQNPAWLLEKCNVEVAKTIFLEYVKEKFQEKHEDAKENVDNYIYFKKHEVVAIKLSNLDNQQGDIKTTINSIKQVGIQGAIKEAQEEDSD